MKRATKSNSPVKSRYTATGDTTDKQQHERDQEQTQQQQQQQQQQLQSRQLKHQQNQPFYCPTDETDLTIGDQQQVSLLDPRESSDGRQQPTLSVKGTTFNFAANMIGGKKTDNADQAHQQQVKKLSVQKKKNILGAGDGNDEDLESNSDSPRSGRKGSCWLYIILMVVLIGLFLVVITLAFTNVFFKPDQGDTCPDINQSFQSSSYRLFATKTVYYTALNYLSLVPLNQAAISPPTAEPLVSISPDTQENGNANAQQQTIAPKLTQTIHYDKSSIYRPNFFWQNETLEQVHRRLTGPDYNCKASQFQYYGRHAARYPSKREISRMSEAFESIKKRIDLIISPSTVSQGQQETSNSTKPACFDPLQQFSNWRMFANENQANLITRTGAIETQNIASRFKQIYPELFDASDPELNITFKITNKIRTAQTAVNFLKQLKNFTLDGCALDQFPSEDADSNLRENKCYKNLVTNHQKKELSFHKTRCAASIDESVKLNLDRAALTDWITESVSKRLKLENAENQLKYNEMKALYDMCKYETAITGYSSIWCSLFTEQQMKYLEYLEDLKSFKKVAYGDPKQSAIACLLTNELIDQYDYYTQDLKPSRKSTFYFTHSQVIQKILASSVGLAGDVAFEDYESKLKSRDVPKKRQWQSSLLSPFSANMAFILYGGCGATTKSNNDNFQGASSGVLDVSRKHSRLLVVLNEQPISMEVINHGKAEIRADFPVDLFFSKARFTKNKDCNLQELCRVADAFEDVDFKEDDGEEDEEHDESA